MLQIKLDRLQASTSQHKLNYLFLGAPGTYIENEAASHEREQETGANDGKIQHKDGTGGHPNILYTNGASLNENR